MIEHDHVRFAPGGDSAKSLARAPENLLDKI